MTRQHPAVRRNSRSQSSKRTDVSRKPITTCQLIQRHTTMVTPHGILQPDMEPYMTLRVVSWLQVFSETKGNHIYLFIMVSYAKYTSNKKNKQTKTKKNMLNIHLHYTAYIIHYILYCNCNLIRCQIIYNTVKFIFR